LRRAGVFPRPSAFQPRFAFEMDCQASQNSPTILDRGDQVFHLLVRGSVQDKVEGIGVTVRHFFPFHHHKIILAQS
jgi:hypothetical protein